MAISSGGTRQPGRRKNTTSLPIDVPLHDGVAGDENTQSAGRRKTAKGSIYEMLNASHYAGPGPTSERFRKFEKKHQALPDRETRKRKSTDQATNGCTSKVARKEPKDSGCVSSTNPGSHPHNDSSGKKVKNSSTTFKTASSKPTPTNRTTLSSIGLQNGATFRTSPASRMVAPVPSPRSMTRSHAGKSSTPKVALAKSARSPTTQPASPLLNRSNLNGGCTGTSFTSAPAAQDKVARFPSRLSFEGIGADAEMATNNPFPAKKTAQKKKSGNKRDDFFSRWRRQNGAPGPSPFTCKECGDPYLMKRNLGCFRHRSEQQITAIRAGCTFGKTAKGGYCMNCKRMGAYCKQHETQDPQYRALSQASQMQLSPLSIPVQPIQFIAFNGGSTFNNVSGGEAQIGNAYHNSDARMSSVNRERQALPSIEQYGMRRNVGPSWTGPRSSPDPAAYWHNASPMQYGAVPGLQMPKHEEWAQMPTHEEWAYPMPEWTYPARTRPSPSGRGKLHQQQPSEWEEV